MYKKIALSLFALYSSLFAAPAAHALYDESTGTSDGYVAAPCSGMASSYVSTGCSAFYYWGQWAVSCVEDGKQTNYTIYVGMWGICRIEPNSTFLK